MPTAYIKTLSRSGKGSVAELEKKWDRAKELAEEEGHAENYAYVTGIFNRMIGKKKAGLASGVTQEDINNDITDRMGQTTERRPDYSGQLFGALSGLTPDIRSGDKGGKKVSGDPFKNSRDISSGTSGRQDGVPNFMNRGEGAGNAVARPDPVARPADIVKKDLMPDEYTNEERYADNIADSSFGSSDMNLLQKTSAIEWVWGIINDKTIS